MIRSNYDRCLRYTLVTWGITILCGVIMASSLGCITTLHGEGEVMFGMRNDNFFVFKHTTRKLTEDSDSRAEISVTPLIDNIVTLKEVSSITTPEKETEPGG